MHNAQPVVHQPFASGSPIPEEIEPESTPLISYERAATPVRAQQQQQQNSSSSSMLDDASLENPLDMIANTKIGGIFVFFMKYGMRIFGYMLVVAALSLMVSVSYLWFYIMVPMLSKSVSLFFLVNVILGLFVCFNVFFNYVLAIRTNPGNVTQEWLQSMENEVDAETLRKEDTSGSKMWSKYCRRCRIPKPARVHHCHICDKCVSRMDHHCPWVNNCVGYKNHRYFVLFLFYLWFACIYISAVLILINFNMISTDDLELYYEYQSWLTFVMILCGSLGVTLTGFLCWHLYLVFTNQTTIEFQFNKMKWLTSQNKGELALNEFDLGFRLNIEQLFGQGGILSWIMPTLQPPPLDGCHWPTIHNHKKS